MSRPTGDDGSGASALVALRFREPGFERVALAADGACVSTVGLTETR